jgi:hypothetical protein
MSTDDPSTSELLRGLSDDLVQLVRSELQHAQIETLAKVREAQRGVTLLAGAGALGGLAAGMSGVLVLRVLDRWLPPRTAALVVTSLYGAGAAGLAAAGVAELKRVGAPVPEETLHSVRRDIQAVRPGHSPTDEG